MKNRFLILIILTLCIFSGISAQKIEISSREYYDAIFQDRYVRWKMSSVSDKKVPFRKIEKLTLYKKGRPDRSKEWTTEVDSSGNSRHVYKERSERTGRIIRYVEEVNYNGSKFCKKDSKRWFRTNKQCFLGMGSTTCDLILDTRSTYTVEYETAGDMRPAIFTDLSIYADPDVKEKQQERTLFWRSKTWIAQTGLIIK